MRELRRAAGLRQGPRTPFERVETELDEELFRNGQYEVKRERLDPTGNIDGELRLRVSRLDGTAVRDWRDLQNIKNELAGPEREAAELFPAESRLVDTGNVYHLWVLSAGVIFPWGPTRRAVLGPGARGDGVSQRSFD
jgi:hypothetical protein